MIMTKNFSLAELTATNTGLKNFPNADQVARLKRLAEVLEKVRTACGNRPVIISSGFRSYEVNRAVGGSKTSAHMRGDAADFRVSGLSIAEACKIIRESGIGYDQLIEEYHNGSEWIHLGLSENPRQQNLLFKNGVYSQVHL